MARLFLTAASTFAFLSVALGAFGAHGLKDRISASALGVFKTGVEYQFFHALALAWVGMAFTSGPSPLLKAAGLFFIAGILIFSGSLYLLSLTQIRAWGAVTPLGGVCFLTGWALLVWHYWKS